MLKKGFLKVLRSLNLKKKLFFTIHRDKILDFFNIHIVYPIRTIENKTICFKLNKTLLFLYQLTFFFKIVKHIVKN